MTTRDATKPPSNMIAFPSLSSGLHSLPQVTSLQNVSLHPNMYAQRAAESEAKVSTVVFMIWLSVIERLVQTVTKGSVQNSFLFYTDASPITISAACQLFSSRNTVHDLTTTLTVTDTAARILGPVDDAAGAYFCHMMCHMSLIDIDYQKKS